MSDNLIGNQTSGERGFVLKDSRGKYDCKIFLSCFDGKAEWCYVNTDKQSTGNLNRENLELKLQEIQELARLSGLEEAWVIEEIPLHEFVPLTHESFHCQFWDLEKGQKTKIQKEVSRINKKYKLKRIFN